MCMEMSFQSYQQACEGMLEAKDKKQYLKEHADKMIELFKKRDVNDFFYWKFCHDVYHLTEYCIVNTELLGCKEPKLAKLHDLAEYDKDLYHMGEYTYSNGEFLKRTKKNEGFLHPYIMDIVDRYKKREKKNFFYQIFCDWSIAVLEMAKKKPQLRILLGENENKINRNYMVKLNCRYNYISGNYEEWKDGIKKLYQKHSARTNDGPKSRALKF